MTTTTTTSGDIQQLVIHATSLYDHEQTISFELKNNSAQSLNKLRVVFGETSLTFPRIQRLASSASVSPYGSLKVTVTRRIKPDCFPRDIPLNSTVQVFDLKGLVASHTFAENIACYSVKTLESVNSLQCGSHNCKLNVLVFGLAGSTKSSFVNACASMMNAKDNSLKNIAQVGAADHHVTKQILRYQFEDMNFQLVDTWGITKSNYAEFTIEDVLNGALPFGWSKDFTRSEHQQQLVAFASTAVRRMVHQVIFVVPIGALEDDAYCLHLKNYFAKLCLFVGNPIVVLSLADTVDPAVRDDTFVNSATIKKYKEKCAEKLSIQEYKIYLAVNYTKEPARTQNIDRNTFNTLFSALKYASQFWSADRIQLLLQSKLQQKIQA